MLEREREREREKGYHFWFLTSYNETWLMKRGLAVF